MRHLYRLLGGLCALALLLYPALANTNSTGAISGVTGGPADFGTCVVCHGDFGLNEGTGAVTVAAPAEFVPGETYTLTITVNNTTEPDPEREQGFEVSVQDSVGNQIGELVITDVENTQFALGDSDYVTHTAAGTQLETWSVDWTAPAAEDAPAEVTVYAVGNAANGDGSQTGDYIYATTATLSRTSSAGEPAAVPGVFALGGVYPNPVRDVARVEVAMERPRAVTLTLRDALGRAVRTVEVGVLPVGEQTVALDARDLAAGTYFVEVRTAEGARVRPLTVVH